MLEQLRIADALKFLLHRGEDGIETAQSFFHCGQRWSNLRHLPINVDEGSIPSVQGKRATRHALIDTNYWKSFVHARLAVPMGDPGCLSLSAGVDHRLLAEHLTSEYRVKTQGRGRELEEWKLRTPGTDNHWLDCLVGCAVAASMQGAVLFGTETRKQPRRKIKLSALQAMRR